MVEEEEAAAAAAEGGARDAGEEGGEDEAEQQEEEVSAALDDVDDPLELAEADAEEEEEAEAGALELSDAQAFMQNINAELAGITEGLPADPPAEEGSGAVVHEEDDGSLIFSFEPEEEEANSLGR